MFSDNIFSLWKVTCDIIIVIRDAPIDIIRATLKVRWDCDIVSCDVICITRTFTCDVIVAARFVICDVIGFLSCDVKFATTNFLLRRPDKRRGNLNTN